MDKIIFNLQVRKILSFCIISASVVTKIAVIFVVLYKAGKTTEEIIGMMCLHCRLSGSIPNWVVELQFLLRGTISSRWNCISAGTSLLKCSVVAGVSIQWCWCEWAM